MKKFIEFIKEEANWDLEKFAQVLEEFKESPEEVLKLSTEDIPYYWIQHNQDIRCNLDEDKEKVDIKEKYEGIDVVLVVYWTGGYEVFLMKFTNDKHCGWSAADDNGVWLLYHAFHAISPYDILKTPKIIISEHDPYGEEDWDS